MSGDVKRARTAEEKRQALHDFLHGQEVATLADKLLELADRDHDIARELQQWRKANELGNDPAELETLVNEMLAPGRGFIAWDESASYVRRAEAVLALLEQARGRDAGAAAALCLHALRRAWGVLQQADNSNGEIGGLCQAIGAEWVLSLKAAGPQKAMRAGCGADIELRQSKYLNNMVKQDHRAIKRIVRPKMGFESFRCARFILAGIETMHMINMIKKGQLDCPKVNALSAASQFYSLAF